MSVLSYSDVRSNFKSVMDALIANRNVVTVTRRTGGNIVMVAEDEYNAMAETLHLLSSPMNASRLGSSIASLDAGHGIEVELDT